MKTIIYLAIVFLSLTSCKNQSTKMEAPFVVVVKLKSAESERIYDVAKQYIDLENVYGEVAKKEGKTAEEVWKEFVDFNYQLGRSSPKFTNCFSYHDFEIIEKESNEGLYQISFVDKNKTGTLKEIIYTLEKAEKNWKVTGIKFKK